jgi:glycolate oxidase
MSDHEQFFRELRELGVGDRLMTRPAQLAPYESDGLTAFRQKPSAVLLVDRQEEVVGAIKACHKHDVPFMARGSGTSLSGGSVPVADGLVIAMNRLNRVLKLDPVSRTAVVEPGVINAHVSQAAAAHGLYYAPDPSSGPVCTIGGNVAFNSGGAHCLKYGMTSNHVLGLKVVLPDGEVCELGGDSLEGVGPDLVGGFIGSEGLWGVALEVTLRLLPRPERFYTLQAAYDSLEKAGTAVAMVIASGMLPGAMEIMDRLSMDAATAAVGAEYSRDAKAVLIVELEGPDEEVEAEIPLLQDVIQQSGAYETLLASDDVERQKIWTGRKSAFSAVGRISPDFIVQDGVVPRSKLGHALSEIDRLSQKYGIRVANVFHAGDGNLHPLILYDGRNDGALEKAEELAGEILRLCINLGGSITGEHGVGLEKRDYMSEMFSEGDLQFMYEMRESLDPKQLANPGKMLPIGQAPALVSHGAHPLEKQGVISRN